MDEGLDVITASSGAECIEMAARHTPSVITLDLVMPDVDGWTALAALKANALTASIPVVLVTVLDDPQKGYSFGATDYVAKPIEGDRLAQVVRRYCGAAAPAVLIIDDNEKDREIVRRVLQNDGCVVVEAVDGAEGLAKSETTKFDLIVLDLMMPVMDGFTFVDEIRQRKGSEMPPIVVLTALEMTASNRDRLNGIVADVIQKGEFDRQRFLQEIHRHLHQE
jgi:CheY-like chemotaxis protein